MDQPRKLTSSKFVEIEQETTLSSTNCIFTLLLMKGWNIYDSSNEKLLLDVVIFTIFQTYESGTKSQFFLS